MKIGININIRAVLVAGVLLTSLFAACKTATNKNVTSNKATDASGIQNSIVDSSKEQSIKKRRDVAVAEPYYSYLKRNYAADLKESSIIYFEEKDMDLDGQSEAVVGFGTVDGDTVMKDMYMNRSIDKILVLHNNRGIVTFVGDIPQGGFSCYDVKLVSLHGDQQIYIYVGRCVDRYSRRHFFEIYNLANNEIKIFIKSASATSIGEDTLTDGNHDDKFDGYTLDQGYNAVSKYFIYRFHVRIYYQYQNGTFVFSDGQVGLPKYPDNVDAVVSQYITLRSLWERYNYRLRGAPQRLSALCRMETLQKIPWDSNSWSAFVEAAQDDLDTKIQVKQTGNKAVATAIYTDENTHKETTLTFQLIKTDGKWQIVDIKETK